MHVVKEVCLDGTVIHHGRWITVSIVVEWCGCATNDCMATHIPEANGCEAGWTYDGDDAYCPRHKQEKRGR